MPDTAIDNFVTVDTAGNITFNFTGHIKALGIDFDEYRGPGPAPDNNIIQWSDSSGLITEYIQGLDPDSLGFFKSILGLVSIVPTGDGLGKTAAEIQIVAEGKATAPIHISTITVESGVAGGLGAIDAAITEGPINVAARIIDINQNSKFLQLIKVANHQLAFGTGVSIGFAGNTKSNISTVSHGLGVVPSFVLCWTNDIAVWAGTNVTFICQANNLTATTFDMSAIQPSSLFNPGTIGGNWIAIS
jgi:hypothetical protein